MLTGRIDQVTQVMARFIGAKNVMRDWICRRDERVIFNVRSSLPPLVQDKSTSTLRLDSKEMTNHERGL